MRLRLRLLPWCLRFLGGSMSKPRNPGRSHELHRLCPGRLEFACAQGRVCYGAHVPKARKFLNPMRLLTKKAREDLLAVLKARFEKNMHRHLGVGWTAVQTRLNANPAKLWSLHEMERTGGEPDVVGCDETTGEYIFFDCSPETPKGRTGVCYDREGLESRKEHRPKSTAMDLAAAMGIELLSEEEYLRLQRLGDFDTKTSSWVKTPAEIRRLGGALYCDRRYGRVFVGHNGAQSYYSARGFRGSLKV